MGPLALFELCIKARGSVFFSYTDPNTRLTRQPNMSQLFKTKSIDSLISTDTQEESKKLKRTLGPWSSIAFGIGALVGSGIFYL